MSRLFRKEEDRIRKVIRENLQYDPQSEIAVIQADVRSFILTPQEVVDIVEDEVNIIIAELLEQEAKKRVAEAAKRAAEEAFARREEQRKRLADLEAEIVATERKLTNLYKQLSNARYGL